MRSFVFIIGICSFCLLACTKDGKATIFGVVRHHEAIIPGARVYVKFGSNTFPGTDLSVYDMFVDASALGEYKIESLPKGNSYVYGIGWDPAISDSVFGGIPVNIEKRKSNVNIDVPVTE